MGNEVSCDLPTAVYDANWNKLESKTTTTASSPYREETVPGLVLNQSTGKWYYYGGEVTPEQAAEISNDYLNTERATALAPRSSSSSSYNVSQSYQDPAALALEAQGQAQSAYQFEQQFGLQQEQQAQAKEQWLFEKQNAIESMQLQRETLATTQAQNARSYYLEQQKLTFMQDQFAFESGLALRQEARATEAQMFSQQAQVAGIQLEMASITQQANNLQAQLDQEVSLFNAGKAADVSMFNIDQQTKVAQFNSEMAFNVEQANVQNERLRQQQLIDVASRISDAAADPGDRGKLASLILANSGFGSPDAALAGADLRTGDSLVPLEAMLRQREDILASDPNPFEFTPITAGQATFTPASAVTVQKPDFSGVQMPTVNTTPFDPSSIPTKSTAAPAGGGGFDAANQKYIATGQTTAGNEQFTSGATGQALTAEERAMMPDFVIQDLIAKGLIPAAAEGGQMPGMYLGDEKGRELHVPGFDQYGQRIQQVIPADITRGLVSGISGTPFDSSVPAFAYGTGKGTVRKKTSGGAPHIPEDDAMNEVWGRIDEMPVNEIRQVLEYMLWKKQVEQKDDWQRAADLTGSMKFNPDVPLDPSQIEDMRRRVIPDYFVNPKPPEYSGLPPESLLPGTPMYAYGADESGTKARQFISGDPQMDGMPNPELIKVNNPGPQTSVSVTPVRMGNRNGPSIQPVPNTPFSSVPSWAGLGQAMQQHQATQMPTGITPEMIAAMVQQLGASRGTNTNPLETRPADGRGQMVGQSPERRRQANQGMQRPSQTPRQAGSQGGGMPPMGNVLKKNMPAMADGGIVSGAYLGNPDGDAVHIPIPGTDMTIIMPAKGKGKGMKKMAQGGLYQEQGQSMYEGLLSDTDRTRAQGFLDEASKRAAMGTPFNVNALPTPVFSSSPGTSPFVTDLLASLNAIKRGIPAGYFKEQANQLRPTSYAEGVIGRTR